MSLEFMEEVTRKADAVQQKVLAEILSQNAKTEYLRPFNLDGVSESDAKTIFKSKIPMISYEDIKPFIQRIADGDRSPLLTSNAISELLISSGTSGGERKLIPCTKEASDRIQFLQSLLEPIMKMHVKGVEKGKGLYFMLTRADIKTEGGLTAQSASSSFYKHLVSAQTEAGKDVCTSPREAILCPDTFQSMYTQLLCGLYQSQQVVRIGATFAYGLLRAINFLQVNWQQLTYDIKTGTLNSQVTDVAIRQCMTPIMQPEPDLASFIAQECGNDNWEGIIARLWPNTKCLDTIVTGTMVQYVPALDYYSGGLPKVSMIYVSSEGFHAINLNPMCSPYEVAYTIMPNMAYFEFLPCGSGGVDSQLLVDLVDVKVGKEYEMVVTTGAGLYRYRTGDILRVAGFHNSSPKFEFVRRENVVLSIDADKTTEVQLQAAVDNACRLLNTRVVEYTSCVDTKSFPGHYVVYWELQPGKWPSEEVLAKCCLAMEEALDGMYRALRVLHKSVGPLEIRVVKNGTFEEVAEYAVSRGASIAQYKVPRCVNSKPILDLLDSRVVSNHYSPSLPYWTIEPVLKE